MKRKQVWDFPFLLLEMDVDTSSIISHTIVRTFLWKSETLFAHFNYTTLLQTCDFEIFI